MREWLKNLSIRKKILLGYISMIAITILLIFILIGILWNRQIKESIRDTIYSSNYQIKKSIDNYFDSIIKLSEFPYLDKDIMTILKKDYSGVSENKKTVNQLNDINTINPKLYRHIYYMHNQVDAVWLYPDNMDYCAYRSSESAIGTYPIETESWFEKVKEGNGKPFIIGVHEEKAATIKWDVISVARGIMDPDTGKYLGMIVIDCAVDNFTKLWDSSEYSDSIIAVSDKNGKLIAPEETGVVVKEFLQENAKKFIENQKMYQVTFSNQNWYMAKTELKYMDGTIYQFVPSGNAIKNAAFTFILAAVFLAILGIILILFSVIISNTITQPMNQLIQMMETVESGNLSFQTEEFYGEMKILSQKFNHMMKRIDAMFAEVKKKEKEKREMEMLALRSQINPHFLYNTLNSIQWLSELQGADKVTQMLDALIQVLHYIADDTSEFVTVEKEEEFIRSYIKILNFRYFERFSFALNVQKEVLKFEVPRCILQPLVENAVIHGFDNTDLCATVKIDIYKEEKCLFLCVTDDGKGLSQEKIEEILNSERSSHKSLNKIGIYNINQRIKLTYGQEYSIHIDSKEECFTKVTVRIPLRKGL